MASVQELIDAANAQKSPVISALEGLARGYLNGQQQALERTKTLIMLEQNRREQENKIANQKRINAQYATDTETARKQALSGVATKPGPVLATQKLEQKIVRKYGTDAHGNRTMEEEFTSGNDNDEAKSIDAILARKVDAGEITIDQAYKLKGQSSMGGVQFVGMQNGTPVLMNKVGQFSTGSLPGNGPLVSKDQTEGQANATLYGNRASQAHDQIEKLSGDIDLTSSTVAVQGKLPNIAKSSQVQQFEQAKRNFINSILRRESGMAISPSEFENGDKQYFPQFGDSEEVIAQKKINRETAIDGLRNAAGLSGRNSKYDSQLNKQTHTKKIGRFSVVVH